MDKRIISGTVWAGAAALAAGGCAPRAAEQARPNVVFILADDLGWGDLSSYGQQRFETPNNDALASYGTGAYAPDLIHAKALEFLDGAAKDGKPFFPRPSRTRSSSSRRTASSSGCGESIPRIPTTAPCRAVPTS